MAVIAESLYCFFALYFFQFLAFNTNYIYYSKIVTILLLLGLGLWSFVDTKNQKNLQPNPIIKRGYIALFLHPQQIPFWLFWGLVLKNHGLSLESNKSIVFFTIGNALGTCSVLLLYVFLGIQLLHFFDIHKTKVKQLVGLICIIGALLQLVAILQ